MTKRTPCVSLLELENCAPFIFLPSAMKGENTKLTCDDINGVLRKSIGTLPDAELYTNLNHTCVELNRLSITKKDETITIAQRPPTAPTNSEPIYYECRTKDFAGLTIASLIDTFAYASPGVFDRLFKRIEETIK